MIADNRSLHRTAAAGQRANELAQTIQLDQFRRLASRSFNRRIRRQPATKCLQIVAPLSMPPLMLLLFVMLTIREIKTNVIIGMVQAKEAHFESE